MRFIMLGFHYVCVCVCVFPTTATLRVRSACQRSSTSNGGIFVVWRTTEVLRTAESCANCWFLFLMNTNDCFSWLNTVVCDTLWRPSFSCIKTGCFGFCLLARVLVPFDLFCGELLHFSPAFGKMLLYTQKNMSVYMMLRYVPSCGPTFLQNVLLTRRLLKRFDSQVSTALWCHQQFTILLFLKRGRQSRPLNALTSFCQATFPWKFLGYDQPYPRGAPPLRSRNDELHVSWKYVDTSARPRLHSPSIAIYRTKPCQVLMLSH